MRAEARGGVGEMGAYRRSCRKRSALMQAKARGGLEKAVKGTRLDAGAG